MKDHGYSDLSSVLFHISLTICMTNEGCKVYCECGSGVSATSVCNGVQIKLISSKCLQGFQKQMETQGQCYKFSQNYRIVEVGGDLWQSSCPMRCSRSVAYSTTLAVLVLSKCSRDWKKNPRLKNYCSIICPDPIKGMKNCGRKRTFPFSHISLLWKICLL